MRSLALALALLTTSVALGADDKDKAPAGDLAKFQGHWTGMVGPNKDIPISFEFKKEKVFLKVTREGAEYDLKGEVVLDEKASPRTINWVKFIAPGGESVDENLGIYKFEDDDTLTICSGGPGNERPTEFKKGEGGPPTLTTLKRQKGDAKPKDEAKKEEVKCTTADEAPKGDAAKLAGSWEAKIGENKDRTIVVEFKDKAAIARISGGDGNAATFKGEFAINEAATPRTIDFTKFKGEDGNEIGGDNLGIYKIEGDTLTICVGGHGNPRPSEFKGESGGDGPNLWTFTRKK